MHTKEEFVKVFVEVRDQFGEIIEKKFVIRAVDYSKQVNYEAKLSNGKGYITLPRNTKFLIFHEIVKSKDYLEIYEKNKREGNFDEIEIIIEAKDFIIETNQNLEKIVVKAIRAVFVQDFIICEKPYYEEVLISNFWKKVSELQNQGKKITGYAKAIFNSKLKDGIVYATLEKTS